jgi:hypothetical protein
MIALVLRDAHGAVVAKQLLHAGQSASIGRSLECSLSSADAYLAPRHASVSVQADGSVLIQDTGTVNGVWLGKAKLAAEGVSVRADASLELGRSSLEIRFEHAAQAAERSLALLRTERRREWVFFSVLSFLGVLTSFFWTTAAAGSASDLVIRLVTGLLYHAAGIAAWTAAWALVTRLVRPTSHWLRHASILLVSLIAYVWVLNGLDLLAFAGSRMLPEWFTSVFTVVIAALLLYGHMRTVAEPDPSRPGGSWGMVGVALALPLVPAVLFAWQNYATETGKQSGNLANFSFWPHQLRVLAPRDSATLFEQSESMKARALKAAKASTTQSEEDYED